MSINCPVCLTQNSDNALTCTVCGSPLNPVQSAGFELRAGTLLGGGKYKIEKILGQGGFGITYQAIAVGNYTPVAIKELLPEKCVRQGTKIIWPFSITPKSRQEQIKKFQEEAECLSKCNHPNIVTVYDWFEENNTAYLVMALITGKSLSKILESEGILPESRVKNYMLQIAAALKCVHTNNLLHRDIKPDNIIVDIQDRAILIDFGAAREFIAGQTNNMTQMLTHGYAPLEQYAYRARRGPSTDIYAVCASMYHLLTGTIPASALLERQGTDKLIPPRQIVPSIHPQTEQIILVGMSMQVGDRFPNVDELIDALNGKFVPPNLRKARQLVQQSQLPEAVQKYEQCLVQDPHNITAAVEVAMVLIYFDKFKAVTAVRRAMQLQPKDGRIYGVLGLIHCREANWAEAVNQLQQAVNLAPNEAWIWANFAWALGKLGNWTQAKTAIEKAIQLDRNSSFALGVKAWISMNQNQWHEVIRSATPAIFQSKKYNHSQQSKESKDLQSWVYPCLTIAMEKALAGKQAPDLERCLQDFLTQLPNNAFAWGFKGWKAARDKKWSEAVASLEQASNQGNVPDWVCLNLAIAREQLRDLQGAIQTLEFYQQNYGDNALSLFRLGTLLGRQGQYSQARTYLETAVQLKPDYAEAYHNLGWVLLQLGLEHNQASTFRDMRLAYAQAVQLYRQQQKLALSGAIEQAFKAIGVEL
jgi:serine/threonine protein kinase